MDQSRDHLQQTAGELRWGEEQLLLRRPGSPGPPVIRPCLHVGSVYRAQTSSGLPDLHVHPPRPPPGGPAASVYCFTSIPGGQRDLSRSAGPDSFLWACCSSVCPPHTSAIPPGAAESLRRSGVCVCVSAAGVSVTLPSCSNVSRICS